MEKDPLLTKLENMMWALWALDITWMPLNDVTFYIQFRGNMLKKLKKANER